jgi:cytochrome c oxidase subunit 1
MHFSGLAGMPRRIYTYDAGQGWDLFNLMSTWGAYTLAIGMVVFVYNFLRSYKNGAIAGNDPWGAATLEWSIPSPPPEYNFARIPRVTSRLPLWDLTMPRLSSGVPHTEGGDKRGGIHIEHPTGKTAKELHIPMPNPTIKPLIAALGMTVMFSGLLFIHKDKMSLALATMIGGALIMVTALYAWVLTPLEDAH